MNANLWISWVIVCIVAMNAVPNPLLAQKYMRPGTIDVSVHTGGIFDLPGATAVDSICLTGTTNCQQQIRSGKIFLPLVGGEAAVSLNRYIWLYGDYSWVFPDSHSVSGSFGTATDTGTADRNYWSTTGGVELSFPTITGIVPLLRVGGGEVHERFNFNDTGSSSSNSYSALTTELSQARSIPAGTAGGGIRWYIRERQGIIVMADAYYLGHGVYDVLPSTLTPGGGAAVTERRSGGRLTVGYFIHFGR
jgi:hypothetical protein